MKRGDVIGSVELKMQSPKKKTITDKRELKKDDQWAYYGAFIQFGTTSTSETRVTEVTLTVKNRPQTVTLTPTEDRDCPLVERSLVFAPASGFRKADGIGEAFSLGTQRLVDKTIMIYENLISMVTGRLSSKTISGPFSIVAASFDIAGRDIFEFILFIALININLAVVNFLPIPILDGGHMVMLVYEWLAANRHRIPCDSSRRCADWRSFFRYSPWALRTTSNGFSSSRLRWQQ